MNILPSGFINPEQISIADPRGGLPVSRPLISRFESGFDPETQKTVDAFLRGEISGDSDKIMASLMAQLNTIQRGITTSTTALPIRENLEAEAKVLVPVETPFRNRLPRVPGAGTAAAWRVVASLGGGWGTVGDQPGGGTAAQYFFGETGTVGETETSYLSRSGAYKIMGERRSVTGLAQASGMTFQDNFAKERTNAILNLMLKEENALINGNATATAVPWGDGTTAFGYDGILRQVATANGTPSAHIQTGVGALTFAHIDAQLRRIWGQGGQRPFIMVNATEALSIKNIAQGSSSIHRVIFSEQGNSQAGVSVQAYTHPITGERVPILTNRFMPAGTMVFGSEAGPQGDAAAEVDVLPVVQMPEYNTNDPIQGYVAQELMPTASAPLVYGFIVFCFSVLKLKIATVYATSTGVTAV